MQAYRYKLYHRVQPDTNTCRCIADQAASSRHVIPFKLLQHSLQLHLNTAPRWPVTHMPDTLYMSSAKASTNSTPYGFATQAQADAVVANVRDIRAFMVAQGWKATS